MASAALTGLRLHQECQHVLVVQNEVPWTDTVATCSDLELIAA